MSKRILLDAFSFVWIFFTVAAIDVVDFASSFSWLPFFAAGRLARDFLVVEEPPFILCIIQVVDKVGIVHVHIKRKARRESRAFRFVPGDV